MLARHHVEFDKFLVRVVSRNIKNIKKTIAPQFFIFIIFLKNVLSRNIVEFGWRERSFMELKKKNNKTEPVSLIVYMESQIRTYPFNRPFNPI